MSVFFFDESGEAEGVGLAARNGVITAMPKANAARQEKRMKPEANDEVG
jgi:hypothetical protein